MEIKNIKFENNIKEWTNCSLYFPKLENKKSNSKPLVLLIHGFRAFKDWGFFPYFAEKIAEFGYFASTIDFSLNTLIDKEKCLFDMERFSKNTVTQEITEAKLFLSMLNNKEFVGEEFAKYWNGDVYLIGHSLGGALAIITAEGLSNVKKLATICSIFDFDIYTERQKEDWIKNGFKEFTDSTTNQKIKLDVNFLLDRLTYSGEKSLTSVVSKLNIPYYILHTEADATVSPKAATILANAVSNKKLLKMDIIKSGNHLLNSSHPFKESNPVLEKIISSILDFFDNFTVKN
jgi:predicted alpha/beta-fold hydrolase